MGVLPLGGAVLTGAGRLPFRAIIHVAGIGLLWRSSEKSIRDSVRNALALATREGFRSVAFPLIGAGTGGGRTEEVQRIMEDEIRKADFSGEVILVRYKRLAKPNGAAKGNQPIHSAAGGTSGTADSRQRPSRNALWRAARASAVAALLAVSTGIVGGAAAKTPAPTYGLASDLPYLPEGLEATDYQRERCRLDVYHPENSPGFATVVWFHGGGLKGGERAVPEGLKQQGIAVVAVNYRLNPKVSCPAYLEDAAAAVAWTFRNIARYGGDPDRIFVSGHSAGGYLTSMVGMDKRWLAAHDIDTDRIAGLIPLSGHTITHMTVRAERGIPDTQPVVDEFAPLFHVRADAPPILLVTGDREMEMLGRYEENAYFMRMLKVAGHPDVTLFELQGYGHGMVEPALKPMLSWMRERLKAGGSGSP